MGKAKSCVRYWVDASTQEGTSSELVGRSFSTWAGLRSNGDAMLHVSTRAELLFVREHVDSMWSQRAAGRDGHGQANTARRTCGARGQRSSYCGTWSDDVVAWRKEDSGGGR